MVHLLSLGVLHRLVDDVTIRPQTTISQTDRTRYIHATSGNLHLSQKN